MVNAQNTVTKLAITPVSRTAGHTQVGFIDTLGADYVEIDVSVSDIATTGTVATKTFTAMGSDAVDTNVSNAVTVVADRTGLKFARNVTYKVDTRTKKRYLHLTFTAGSAGVSNETQLVSAVAKTTRTEQFPSATGGMVSGLTNSVAVIVT